MIFVFDMDNTICERKLNGKTYADVEPYPEALETIRWLKVEGHTVILQTGRHMKTCEGNTGKVLAKQGKVLFDWLEKHNLEFDEIWWNKPHADLIIDDAAHKHTDWPSTVEAIKNRITKGPRGPENP